MCMCGGWAGRKGEAGVTGESALKAQLRALLRGKRCPKYEIYDTQEALRLGREKSIEHIL